MLFVLYFTKFIKKAIRAPDPISYKNRVARLLLFLIAINQLLNIINMVQRFVYLFFAHFESDSFIRFANRLSV
jgi:hypothetical protein